MNDEARSRGGCRRFLLAIALIPALAGLARAEERRPFAIGETVTLHSKILGEERTLFIYTHQAYGEDQSRYPVAYVLDGEWNFHQTSGVIDLLSSREVIPWMIVVGIANVDRMRDLSPTPIKEQPRSGGAAAFRRFLREEVFPFVEARYRTEPFRLLVGHSLGGLFAIDTLLGEPELFSAYLAVGPYLVWDDNRYLDAALAKPAAPWKTRKFLSAILGEEPELRPTLQRLEAALAGRGSSLLECRCREIAGFDHVSVYPPAIARGLLDIFPDWRLPPEAAAAGLEGIRAHYAGLTSRYGYPIRPVYFVLLMIADDFIGKGEIDEAVRILRQAVAQDPALPHAHSSLGRCYRLRGMINEARRCYQEALRIAPDDAEARRALAELE
ncbi:MAG: tetratricopeptide repeat protein [Candidatus Aminicenantes bacterium]|nr:tetratricopeptide repeat protein [Candidatus Aminicenantes bacterium]